MGQPFVHGSVGGIDRRVEVGGGLGVAVGDADASDRLPAQLVGSLPGLPVGVEELQVLVGITVGPAIHRDRVDIALGIETVCTEHGGQLLLHFLLEGGEGSAVEAVVP